VKRIAAISLIASAVAALSALASAQMPAQPVDPQVTWLTHEQAVVLREQAIDAAVSRGEVIREGRRINASDSATPETRFRIWGQPYPGAPRWYERQAVEVHLTNPHPDARTTAPGLDVSRDGSWVAMPAPMPPHNELIFFNVETGQGWRLRGPSEGLAFRSVVFSPVDDILAVAVHALPGNGLGEVWLLDYAGALLGRHYSEGRALLSPDFSPDGRFLSAFETTLVEDEDWEPRISPEYAAVWGMPAARLVQYSLRTGEANAISNALFGGVDRRRAFYSADGRNLILPQTWTQSLVGAGPVLSNGSILHANIYPLPSDAASFVAHVNAFSSEGRRSGLQVTIGAPEQTRLSPAPFSYQGTPAVAQDRASGALLLFSRGPASRAGSAQILSLSVEGRAGQRIAYAPTGAMREHYDLSGARLSEDRCTLAFYRHNLRLDPEIEVRRLCRTDTPARVHRINALNLASLRSDWSFEND